MYKLSLRTLTVWLFVNPSCPLDSGVFGVPLNTLLEKDRKKFPGVKVPVVFQKVKNVSFSMSNQVSDRG